MKDHISELPISSLSDDDGAASSIARALDVLYFSGKFPHWRAGSQKSVNENSRLGPGYGTLVRSFSGASAISRMARYRPMTRSSDSHTETWAGPDWIMRAQWQRYESTVGIDVLAETAETAEKVLADALAGLDVRPVPEDETEVKFRLYSPQGGSNVRHRSIDLTTWKDIKGNYTTRARKELEKKLVNLEPDDIHGRIILLHGPTGSGKTTFLRALISEWQDWCEAEYIMDPDKMFGNAQYLLSVTLATGTEEYSEEECEVHKWRLLVLEDCGEFLTGTAKKEMGQALSQLLNITDGLPGQGLRLLVLITSNEDLTRFHPAITRPGRCLANIEVPEFTYGEASRWIGKKELLPAQRMYSLAELITLREGGTISAEEPPSTGQFL